MDPQADKLAPLRNDIRDLGRWLGDVLAQRGGEVLLQRVEAIRAQTKAARQAADDPGAPQASLEGVAHTLTEIPLDESVPIARAFAHFLRLANIAEQHHRVRRRRQYKLATDQPFQPGSADREFGGWVREGIPVERIQESLRDLHIELVLTAHPTEAARRTTLRLQQSVARLLAERDRSDLTPDEREDNMAALRRVILDLWESDELRHEKPTPIEEARWGLAVVEQSLWSVVPAFVRSLERALQANGGECLPPEIAPITFASWMGGDRDGNPFVTPEVTASVVALQQWMGADLFGREIDRLRDELSVTAASDELRDLVGDAPEPYRALLRTLRRRIEATKGAAERRLSGECPDSEASDADPIASRQDLLDPLRLAHRSLTDRGLGSLARGRLTDVMRQAATFGPCLLRLDLRQESSRHTQALDAVTRALGLPAYESLEEEARLDWLAGELDNPRPLVPTRWSPSPEVADVIETLRTAARLPREALGSYVISMCRRASDVLAVDLLQKDAGVDPPLRIAPLFETQRDLTAAAGILDRLLQVDGYRARHGGRQEIMLGYSDSAKDSGRLSAAWALYNAQEEIVETCRRRGVRPTLFHGRGGTVGRGGGPTWLALQSQPPGSISGRIRVTEQGEMIDAKFGIPEIAARTLELYATGVLQADLAGPLQPQESWRAMMDRIARRSRDLYRRMVQRTPSFLDYFHEATPLQELGSLMIGSRPSRRKPGRDVASLRAIPWVFAWSQARWMVPAWLGLAEGLSAEDEDAEDLLREMYRKWPFFRSTIGLVEMALAKSDTLVAAHYHRHLAKSDLQVVGQELFQRLRAAKTRLLEITGQDQLLESNPVLRNSIAVRNPYVDPLHVLQVELLEKLRETRNETRDPRLVQALNITISGIAAGIRNTG